MEVYNSEQEQVEALKAWWEKNGRSVIVGLVLFLAGVLGWQRWNDYRAERAAAASDRYQQLIAQMESAPQQAMETGRSIVADFGDSVYAQMAAVAMAKLAVAAGDLDGATAHLNSAMAQSTQAELQQLARLRLARVLAAQGKHDEALATLGGEAGSFSAAFAEVRGDIYLAQGKRSEARSAYTQALQGYAEVPEKGRMVQMKLDDLAESTAE